MNKSTLSKRTRHLLVNVTLASGLLASALAGTPDQLPEVAFGWPLLLHVERAALLIGICGVAVLVLWRATGGYFPIQFGTFQLEWEGAIETVGDTHESRLRELELLAGVRPSAAVAEADTDA